MHKELGRSGGRAESWLAARAMRHEASAAADQRATCLVHAINAEEPDRLNGEQVGLAAALELALGGRRHSGVSRLGAHHHVLACGGPLGAALGHQARAGREGECCRHHSVLLLVLDSTHKQQV